MDGVIYWIGVLFKIVLAIALLRYPLFMMNQPVAVT